ncbi:four helix bundle protein [Candidatus Woesearchaeota archaeon]|nr:four helix bundle protein [Candidatus Woesearchaeota archaeon]
MPSDYRTLNVWKVAHKLVLEVKKELLNLIPQEEKYELKRQIWRAAYSIPMNIVEGTGRRTNKDYASFLFNALGSAKEFEYCLLLIKDLNYISIECTRKYCIEIIQVQKMLSGLIKSLTE